MRRAHRRDQGRRGHGRARAGRGVLRRPRIRAAPARHLRDRNHHAGRAGLHLPRRPAPLPSRPAPRRASRRDARRGPGDGGGLRIPHPLRRASAHPGGARRRAAALRRRAGAGSLTDHRGPAPGCSPTSTSRSASSGAPRRRRRSPMCSRRPPDGRSPPGTIALAAVSAVREHLAAHPVEETRADVLERIAGIDRWTIARHFRAAFGTSPDRYRTMRRLEVARSAIAGGAALADAAATAGFADQSHMTRHFKRAYGITPGRWAAATAATRPASSCACSPPSPRRPRAARHEG